MSTALATLAGKLAERVGMDSVDPQELITTLRQPERDITPVRRDHFRLLRYKARLGISRPFCYQKSTESTAAG